MLKFGFSGGTEIGANGCELCIGSFGCCCLSDALKCCAIYFLYITYDTYKMMIMAMTTDTQINADFADIFNF